jgi:hypothetical protein
METEKTAIVIATWPELKSIGITEELTGVIVKILPKKHLVHPDLGPIAEVEYHFKKYNYLIPTKWLSNN